MAFRTAWWDRDQTDRDAYDEWLPASITAAIQALVDRYPYGITKIVITDEEGDRLYVKPLKGDTTIPAGYVEPDEPDTADGVPIVLNYETAPDPEPIDLAAVEAALADAVWEGPKEWFLLGASPTVWHIGLPRPTA